MCAYRHAYICPDDLRCIYRKGKSMKFSGRPLIRRRVDSKLLSVAVLDLFADCIAPREFIKMLLESDLNWYWRIQDEKPLRGFRAATAQNNPWREVNRQTKDDLLGDFASGDAISFAGADAALNEPAHRQMFRKHFNDFYEDGSGPMKLVLTRSGETKEAYIYYPETQSADAEKEMLRWNVNLEGIGRDWFGGCYRFQDWIRVTFEASGAGDVLPRGTLLLQGANASPST
jgi:hypothetical protein